MTAFQDISRSLRQLYLEDKRPWLVGANSSAELWSAAACCRFVSGQLAGREDGKGLPRAS
jgi:hypothetical protein